MNYTYREKEVKRKEFLRILKDCDSVFVKCGHQYFKVTKEQAKRVSHTYFIKVAICNEEDWVYIEDIYFYN